MPLPSPYPYDPTGTATSNKIVNELHVVNPPADPKQANFIVPLASPFFYEGMVLRTSTNISDPELVEGTDFIFTHYFDEGTQALSKPLFGSILFLDQAYSGNVYLSYQSLGGRYVLPDYSMFIALTRSLYNIRTVWFSQITGLPALFPPEEHPHDAADMTGMVDVVAKLNEVLQALLVMGGNLPSLAAAFQQHISSDNAHTPAQIGLPNVPNFGPATHDDLVNLATNKLVTPADVKTMIDLYVP